MSERLHGACLVAHEPRSSAALFRTIARLQYDTGVALHCWIGVTASSVLSTADVNRLARLSGLAVAACERVDDRYFDFSVYAVGATRLIGAGCHDVIFANDTLAVRHGSRYMLRLFADRVSRSRRVQVAFPLMIGPHSRSEYAVADRRHDEYVSTYLFLLNAPAIQVLINMIADANVLLRNLRERRAEPPTDPSLLRLCLVYASILTDRYAGLPDGGDRLLRKLVTVYWERLLAARIRTDGVVWYIGNGIIGQIMIPIQTMLHTQRHALSSRLRRVGAFWRHCRINDS